MNRQTNSNYYLTVLPGIFVLAGNVSGGNFTALNFIFSILIVPVLELFSNDKKSGSEENSQLPGGLSYLLFLMQLLCLASLFYAVYDGMDGWQLLLSAASTGVYSGTVGMGMAHEFLHKNSAAAQWLSKVMLFTTGNFYFYIEHIKVHHKWVGTWRDPATPRQEETLFDFFMRSTWQQIRDAWYLETERLEKEGYSEMSKRNYVLANILLQLVFALLLNYLLGGWAVTVYAVQCFIANFMLEYTNYIEHYGLTRGENEPISAELVWLSDKTISRYFFIENNRQHDHDSGHEEYKKSSHMRVKTPTLPFGYSTGFLIALLPTIWFNIVHLKMRQHKALFLK